MHAGKQVLEWARQHGYTTAQIADELGYPHHTLSQALELNRITPRLASALFERYGLRVAATSPDEDERRPEAPETSGSQDPPYTEPSADAEAGGIAEASPDTYSQEAEPLDAYRREVRRILDKSRCRGI